MFTSFQMEDHLQSREDDADGSKHSETLLFGNMPFVRRNDRFRTEYANRLNHLLGTGFEWNQYELYRWPMPMLSLFIYKHLREDMHIALYTHGNMEVLDPETLVSTVDVSKKRTSQAAIHTFHCCPWDSLVHIVKRGPHDCLHDTALIDRIERDRRVDDGWIPDGGLTVGELVRAAGRFPTMVTIHDLDACRKAADAVPPDESEMWMEWRSTFPKTLEVSIERTVYCRMPGTRFVNMPVTIRTSRFADSPVRLYELHASEGGLCRAGIGDIELEGDEICLSIMIEGTAPQSEGEGVVP